MYCRLGHFLSLTSSLDLHLCLCNVKKKPNKQTKKNPMSTSSSKYYQSVTKMTHEIWAEFPVLLPLDLLCVPMNIVGPAHRSWKGHVFVAAGVLVVRQMDVREWRSKKCTHQETPHAMAWLCMPHLGCMLWRVTVQRIMHSKQFRKDKSV